MVIGSTEVVGLYYLCRENKGDDQLHRHLAADLRLCFSHKQKSVDQYSDSNSDRYRLVYYETPHQRTCPLGSRLEKT